MSKYIFNYHKYFENKDLLKGGKADHKTIEDVAKHHSTPDTYSKVLSDLKKEFEIGIEDEKEEHTDNLEIAKEITLDHLWKNPKYYSEMMNKENIQSSIFDRNHEMWISQYPELKLFNLETDYDDNKFIWLYSFNKKYDSYNIDMFIEIKKGDNWEIEFELTQESNDEQNFHSQDEKHFRKAGLDTLKFQAELGGICRYIKEWNEKMEDKLGFFPLIDSE